MKLLIGVVALAGALTGATPARAQGEEPSRPYLLTFDAGLTDAPDHFHYRQGNGVLVVPGYLGVTLAFPLHGPLEANLAAGDAFEVGWIVGATGRFASRWDGGVRFTAGAGPMLAGGDFGRAWFAQADVTFEARSRAGFAFVIGPKIAVALTGAGSRNCYIDTCDGFVALGDRIFLLRFGIGFNI